MKLRMLCRLLPLALTGCAGSNHTLFMTKSNFGLDFDSKPPTLEISLARKEAVIAPSFEGAQTPPVMASFKPHSGTGSGFENFFLGVDQTFAGGDAAMAMSMLYDKPTATDPSPYEAAAAISLTKKPSYWSWFRKIPGEGVTRPFIFGTDTSLGLKAAWSGVGGQVPDTVRLGFNRKEFAWAPINATPVLRPDGKQDGKKVDVRMPAFLATIESKQELAVNGTARVQALQYFATGKAATHLAMQQDVRRAMHARLDPNTGAFKDKFIAQGADVIPDILFSMETVLRRHEDRGDARAAGHRKKLGTLAGVELPANYRTDDIPIYVFDSTAAGGPLLKKNQGAGPVTLVGTSLATAIGFLSALENSHRSLTNAIGAIAQGQPVQLRSNWTPAGQPTAVTAAMIPQLFQDADALKNRSSNLIKQIASNPDVEAAYDFVQRKLNP